MSNAKQLAVLSTKNLNSHRWLYAKMAIAFAVLVFLVCLFSTFAISLNVKQNDLKNASMSQNYAVTNEPVESLSNVTQTLNMTNYNFAGQMWDWTNKYTNYLCARWLSVELDGQAYDVVDDSRYEEIQLLSGDKFWTDNDVAESKIKFGVDGFVKGNMPQNGNETLVSELTLRWYGISADGVIGKTLRLLVKNEQNTVVVDYVTICGVISERFYQLEGHECYGFYWVAPSLWLGGGDAVNTEGVVEDWYVYAFERWLTQEQIDLLDEYEGYYVGYGVVEDMRVVESLQSVTLKLFLVVGLALGITLVLMIFLMMDKFIGVFSRDGGILLSCGMEWRRVKALLLCLLLWVCLFAVLIAAALTASSYFAIRYLIYSYYDIEITVTFATISTLFAIGVATVLVIAFGYYLYAVTKLKRCTIKDFLNTHVN